MDFKTLMVGVDLNQIEKQLQEVIEMVKQENEKVALMSGEDRVYILLDIKEKDIIAYRVTTGEMKFNIGNIEPKPFLTVKRTIGKYTLSDIKNLVPGQDISSIENTVRRVMPLIYGMNSLIKLHKDEKKVMIQLDMSDKDIIAYQVVTAVKSLISGEKFLVISRVLGKHILTDYLK